MFLFLFLGLIHLPGSVPSSNSRLNVNFSHNITTQQKIHFQTYFSAQLFRLKKNLARIRENWEQKRAYELFTNKKHEESRLGHFCTKQGGRTRKFIFEIGVKPKLKNLIIIMSCIFVLKMILLIKKRFSYHFVHSLF